nr:hypothetical protein [uncultured Pseudomonas sp.]
MALEDNRDDIKGKVFLLLDTDKAFEKYEASDSIKQISIKRIHNDEKEFQTLLKSTSNTEFYPPTVIEDTLMPDYFISTLKTFIESEDYGAKSSSLLKVLKNNHAGWPASLAFDLRGTQQRDMEELFDLPGFKVQFALKYAKVANNEELPAWMQEVNEFLFPTRKRARPVGRAAKVVD